ncbi:hypothetical protein DDB_G0273145 [Dictyostelium discoideum AX4]|uniref:Uncharacterized protein n=1 Tax=Dictyostelium discoideum TaxID=44689 RepID=Q557F2_DICDI|nr:hypothetical protein DDB_G0273599 [Dictyostelium discoideum AX4]XP_644834.1 hypothetical protein DDB_G0273145 [Dictyostelium discoideum AX4]EAL70490.1 hypothetical protein DDB_G0273599 [Dictyostelium discoideum AX4]EAL70790.1 hypothetical protein DDB_G0273145 [Dictyostelium discoideum AX4]|eukprot:XP_644416.1 hypothetical protein DDB_G0273599 [Dictyostelium discoideum AX4]
MKLNYNFYFLIILLIFLIINKNQSQIVKGPKIWSKQIIDTTFMLNQGINFTVNNITNDSNKMYQRYDWSFMRFFIHNNKSKLLMSTDYHPRVDEFTTIKIPNTNFMVQNEHYTVWAEFPGLKNISTFTSVRENQTFPCTFNNSIGVMETLTNYTDCKNNTSGNYTKEVIVNTETFKLYPIILPPKHIFSNLTQSFVNYFTIIVQLENGKIVDAVWDGDRIPGMCEKQCDQCIDSQCGVKVKDMKCNELRDNDKLSNSTIINGTTTTTTTTTGTSTTTPSSTPILIRDGIPINGCQVKSFIAWAGVDRLGKPCQSINKIPSKFQEYSATSIKKIGTGLLTDFLYRVNDQNNPNTP